MQRNAVLRLLPIRPDWHSITSMDLPVRRPRLSRDERGAALAELAIVLPIMLMLILVLYDFGRGFLAYVTVTNGARDAARVAMQDDKACTAADLTTTAQNSAAPYSVTVNVWEDAGNCYVQVSHVYSPILPFVTTSWSLPMVGQIGPLWDGTMSETMVSR